MLSLPLLSTLSASATSLLLSVVVAAVVLVISAIVVIGGIFAVAVTFVVTMGVVAAVGVVDVVVGLFLHVPAADGDAPAKYSPALLQVVWSLHDVSLCSVDDWYWPGLQLLHVPAAEADAPDKYCPALHSFCSLHRFRELDAGWYLPVPQTLHDPRFARA